MYLRVPVWVVFACRSLTSPCCHRKRHASCCIRCSRQDSSLYRWGCPAPCTQPGTPCIQYRTPRPRERCRRCPVYPVKGCAVLHEACISVFCMDVSGTDHARRTFPRPQIAPLLGPSTHGDLTGTPLRCVTDRIYTGRRVMCGADWNTRSRHARR